MFYGKKFMDRMGWGQQELADKLGCAQSRVSDLNSGARNPKFSEIMTLIDLGITLEELFGKAAADKLKSREPVNESFRSSPDFQRGVNEAVISAQEALLASLKEKLK